MDNILYFALAALAVTAIYFYQALKDERDKSKRYAHTVASMLLDQRHIDHVRNHFVAEFDPFLLEMNLPKRGEVAPGPDFWLLYARMWLPAAEKAARIFGAYPSDEGFASVLENHYTTPSS